MNALVMILALSFVSTTASPTLELRSLSAECIALLAASPSPTHPSLIAETYLKLIAGFSLPLLQQLLVDPTLVPLASSGVIHVNQGNALRSIIRDYILKLNPSDKNACLQEIRLRIAELLKQPQIDREVSPPLPPTPSRESFISKLDLDQRVQPAFSHDRKFMVFQRGHDLVVEALDGSQVPQIFDSTPLRAARVPNFECLNFSADDRYITAIHDMQMVTVWDRQTGRLASSVDVKRWAYLAILSTDHSKIWVRTSIGVFAFHLKDGNQSAKFLGNMKHSH